MLQPAMRKSKNFQALLRPAEFDFVKQFCELKGIDARDLILSATAYHAHIKNQLTKGAN